MSTNSSLSAQTTRQRRQLFRRTLIFKKIAPFLCHPATVSDLPAIIVAPHQDDETFGCGGIIALKRRRKVPVTVIFVTDGSLCHGSDLSESESQALIALREKEAIAALAILGVEPSNIVFLRFPDGKLPKLEQSRNQVLQGLLQTHLLSVENAEIFVPHRRDSHPDHEATYAAVRSALIQAKEQGKTVPILYEYPVWLFWSRNRFFSNLFLSDFAHSQKVAVDDVLEQKRAAIQAYPSQLALLPEGFADHFLFGYEFFFRSNL